VDFAGSKKSSAWFEVGDNYAVGHLKFRDLRCTHLGKRVLGGSETKKKQNLRSGQSGRRSGHSDDSSKTIVEAMEVARFPGSTFTAQDDAFLISFQV
jgi:hypothetical protein